MTTLERLKLAIDQARIRMSEQKMQALLIALEENELIPRITIAEAAERLGKTRAWVHRVATRLELGQLENSPGRGRLMLTESEFDELSAEVGRPRGYHSHESQRRNR